MPGIFAVVSSLNQEVCLFYDGKILAIRYVAKDIEKCAKLYLLKVCTHIVWVNSVLQ